MDVNELFEAVKDPAQHKTLADYVASNKTVLRDEFGETYELIAFDGLNLPVAMFQGAGSRRLHQLNTRRLRDDDIILVTFPKTGTHWMCNILHFLLHDPSLEESISIEPTFLETYTAEELEAVTSPRILPTHMRPDLLPADVFKRGRKIILTFRNPKDTAVSLYHHARNDRVIGNELRVSWDCFIDCWMKGLFLPFDFFEFYNSWENLIQKRTELNILVVNYEDMKMNGLKEVKRMQKYLGMQYSDDRLLRILDRCSLTNLKADVDQNKVNSPFLTRNGSSYVYRKGIIGDWKNQFTASQNTRLEEIAARKFRQSIFKWDV